MEIDNMKNIVVLKDLPSNIVEEAFVIVKPNIRIKKLNFADKKKNKERLKADNNKEYIVKEAEMLIANYISSIEKNNKLEDNSKLEKQYKRLKKLTFLLGIVSLLGILSNLLNG